MLALVNAGVLIRTAYDGEHLEALPTVWTWARDGWEYGEAQIVPVVDNPPARYLRVASKTVNMVDGVPTMIYEVLPPLTTEEIRANMPVLERTQVLLALDGIGITEAMVDECLKDNRPGMIEWKNRLRFRRDHYLIDGLGALFALPPEQIDSLWEWATEL